MGSKTARNALIIGITLRPKPGARCTIDIDSFVLGAEIDRRFFDTPYYVTPNDPVGQEALVWAIGCWIRIWVIAKP
jgi:hypothetical protein